VFDSGIREGNDSGFFGQESIKFTGPSQSKLNGCGGGSLAIGHDCRGTPQKETRKLGELKRGIECSRDKKFVQSSDMDDIRKGGKKGEKIIATRWGRGIKREEERGWEISGLEATLGLTQKAPGGI